LKLVILILYTAHRRIDLESGEWRSKPARSTLDADIGRPDATLRESLLQVTSKELTIWPGAAPG